jgi:hypothetical protein
MWKYPQKYFMEAITMEFIANLLNNIYTMILGILKNAGVVIEGLPEVLIPVEAE